MSLSIENLNNLIQGELDHLRRVRKGKSLLKLPIPFKEVGGSRVTLGTNELTKTDMSRFEESRVKIQENGEEIVNNSRQGENRSEE